MSSSSSFYQGLQSCFEPLLMEPRVLRLNLSITDSDVKGKPFTNTATSTITNDEHDMKSDRDSLSFFQSLTDICNKTEEPEAEDVYVHPTAKVFSSMLSAKSLEMCTENLGCETGSNASDSSDDMSLFSSEFSSCFIEDTTHTPEPVVEINRSSSSVSKRWNRVNNFPPPLTSLTDFGGVQVRPHREDGRLILEAVTSSTSQPYFQAERSNGRLRLRLFESVDEEVDYDCDDEHEEQACGEEESGADEELEEYIGNEEDEIEITKFARPSRCKESGKRDIFGDAYLELPSLSLCL